ncbi:MAG: carbon starvation protein A [Armatimonadetes bacterium JP3_11]|jgi:carbon starvation protein|nr:MAG: carbon starvation protein A [Armatimonadetes bacterium CP1_7O]OYT76041.1 MAG: carbon starvation protein A [Armatimonadetes bacterium JP3_11]RMH10251.1 MAG: carbon starvation protein A [Armatimonadota bacterium]
MSALLILLGVSALLTLAYRWYGRWLSQRVFQLDDSEPTPAHTLRDGRDFVPAPPMIVFGHHFASIAGLGPLLGPAIAVIWGWAPALLWIVLGSIFVGAVHDLGCLYSSVRNRARSVADLAYDVASARARVLFLLFGIFAIALAMGVFVINIANLFASGAGGATGGHVPEAVLPSVALILLALVVGVLFYRYRISLAKLTLPAVLLSLGFVWLGVQYPITSVLGVGLTANLWIYLLLGYALVATLLPVWLLLQPRDYLNSFQLFLGMALLLGGALVGGFTMSAPAVNLSPKGAPPMFPLLFITIACGAVSGFHSLVASGTTARQLDRQRHALPIGYGAMLTEGLLATLALLAVGAGLGAEWQTRYPDWLSAGKGALANFVHGAGVMVSAVGIPVAVAKVFVATVAVGFALTTLDTGARLIRYNLQELGRAWRIAPLENATSSTLFAVGLIGFFALLKAPDPVTGEMKSVGALLWSLFGASNQLLAALALLVVSLYLRALGRPTLYTLLPMGFMLVATLGALIINMQDFANRGNMVLLGFCIVIFGLAVWLVGEALIAWRRGRAVAAVASE